MSRSTIVIMMLLAIAAGLLLVVGLGLNSLIAASRKIVVYNR